MQLLLQAGPRGELERRLQFQAGTVARELWAPQPVSDMCAAPGRAVGGHESLLHRAQGKESRGCYFPKLLQGHSAL
jgi:hypothetical protein